MHRQPSKKALGFTAIELVVVVVIIGLLSAIAAPIFLNLQVDSRAATVTQISASMRTAAELVYAKAIVENKTRLRNSTVRINNRNERIRYGYPDGRDLRNILLSLSPASNFVLASNATIFRVRHRGAAQQNRCQVQYSRSNVAGRPPTYAVDVRRC